MDNILGDEFKDFLIALNHCNVEYILVGGYAVIFHGHTRTTGDLDIWVNKSKENYKKLIAAFKQFGMPAFDMTEENFLNNPTFDVFTFGRPPVSIDILTNVKGLQFEESILKAKDFSSGGITFKLIDYRDLIQAKKSAARPKDIDDLNNLEK